MRRTRHHKKISFTALFLLTVFVNLYLVQLVCSLPHLAQLLQPVASHSHNAGHGGHSHTHEHETSSTLAYHTGDDHPAAPVEDKNCCTEKGNIPFLKASATVELTALAAAQPAFITALYHTLLAWLYRSHIAAAWYTPPKNLKPKIPDIRVFLHSFLI